MGVKAQRAIEALNFFYDVGVAEAIAETLNSELILVEPLWFRTRGHQELISIEIETAVEAYEQHPCDIKILYSTELSLLDIPPPLRDRIVDASTIITTPCKWLEGMCQMQNIQSMRLCDPVPESIFYNPTMPKDVSVVAMGRISTQKNSEMVLEIFKRLEKHPITRIYIGGADLWGDKTATDAGLEYDIRENCDEFHYNIPQTELAKKLSTIGCAIFDTFHDTGSESNLETNMSGIVSFYGTHKLWQERPGVRDLHTADEFVEAIRRETNNFQTPPNDENRKQTEQWALKNCSYEQFIQEWRQVLSHARHSKP